MNVLHQRLIFIYLFFISIGIQSCDLINPAEPVPSYITIRSAGVQANYLQQGTSSSRITDIWVYADGAYLGTFQLPARIPVLLEGVHKISFGAGIMANGIASTREAYPLYKFIDSTLTLSPGQVTTVDSLTFGYFSGLSPIWYEDFEKDTSGGGISIDTTINSQGNVLPDSTVVFEGKRSLKMEVNTVRPVIECTSLPDDGFILPTGKDVYLELDYICTQEFQLGLIAKTFSGERAIPVIRFNPKSSWNKIYIRLGPYVNANGDAFKFQVYFRMDLSAGGTSGTAYLDNIKLISN
jgi:hypothetical protein